MTWRRRSRSRAAAARRPRGVTAAQSRTSGRVETRSSTRPTDCDRRRGGRRSWPGHSAGEIGETGRSRLVGCSAGVDAPAGIGRRPLVERPAGALGGHSRRRAAPRRGSVVPARSCARGSRRDRARRPAAAQASMRGRSARANRAHGERRKQGDEGDASPAAAPLPEVDEQRVHRRIARLGIGGGAPLGDATQPAGRTGSPAWPRAARRRSCTDRRAGSTRHRAGARAPCSAACRRWRRAR